MVNSPRKTDKPNILLFKIFLGELNIHIMKYHFAAAALPLLASAASATDLEATVRKLAANAQKGNSHQNNNKNSTHNSANP